LGERRRLRFRVKERNPRETTGTKHSFKKPSHVIVVLRLKRGEVVFWSSAGTCGFKSSRKASPYAGQRTTVDAIRTVGLQRAEVMVKGAGSGRDAALRAIAKSGVRLSCIRDVTPMQHNGCRPPKKRRL
ncbi:hypothetical protein PVAP13_5NG586943, partial [Panicum virgatum]